MTARPVLLVSGLVLVTAMISVPASSARNVPSKALPKSVSTSLERIYESFHGYGVNMSPYGLQRELNANAAQMADVLAYGKSSTAHFNCLAHHLLSDLNTYSKRYAPGSVIDRSVLASSIHLRDDDPRFGLDVRAYLLLEMAKWKRAPAFTREVLDALRKVVKASSHVAEQRLLYNHPNLAAAQARSKSELGGVCTTLGAEIAYFCEKFLVSASLSDTPPLPTSAMPVVRDYCRWRRAVLSKEKTDALQQHYQHRTMAYVEKLVRALPRK